MRVVNQVDYAPWVQRCMIAIALMGVVFIGLSGAQMRQYSYQGGVEVADFSCNGGGPFHVVVDSQTSGAPALAEVYCGWPKLQTALRLLASCVALVVSPLVAWKLHVAHALKVKLFAAVFAMSTLACCIADSAAVQKMKGLVDPQVAQYTYFGTFVFLCVWDALYIGIAVFTLYAAHHWHRCARDAGLLNESDEFVEDSRSSSVSAPAYEAPKLAPAAHDFAAVPVAALPDQ